MSRLLSAGSDSRCAFRFPVPSPKGRVALGVLVQGVSQAALEKGPSFVPLSLLEPWVSGLVCVPLPRIPGAPGPSCPSAVPHPFTLVGSLNRCEEGAFDSHNLVQRRS